MHRNELNSIIENLRSNLTSTAEHMIEATEQSHDADVNMQKSHLAALNALRVQTDQAQRLFESEMNTFVLTTRARYHALIETVDALIGYQESIVSQMENG